MARGGRLSLPEHVAPVVEIEKREKGGGIDDGAVIGEIGNAAAGIIWGEGGGGLIRFSVTLDPDYHPPFISRTVCDTSEKWEEQHEFRCIQSFLSFLLSFSFG